VICCSAFYNLDFKFTIMKNLLLSIGISLFFISCSEQSNRNSDTKKPEELIEVAVPSEDKEKRSFYPIPSPEQMVTFINDNGLEYNKDVILDVSLSDGYNDPTHKAIIFGIYIADLAYAAAYQDVESTIKLYKTVQTLSAELNIEELMTKEMMQNMLTNMENPDSLALIAGDSYYKAVEHLESNGQESKLALMSLGGWIESVHITLSAMKDIDINSAAVQRISSQKITFGNLYTYLKNNEDELGIKGELEKIQRIRAVFASLEEVGSSKSTKSKGGKLVFGQGKKIEISVKQFLELKSAIKDYRTQLVNQNSQ
jgi:hypothetical protein